jgi:endonuclease YncB( thermonuclease family)
LERFGVRTGLSERQRAKLYEVLSTAPQSVHSRTARVDQRRQRKRLRARRGRGGLLAREARYLGRRFTRALGLGAALAIGGLVFSLLNGLQPTSQSGLATVVSEGARTALPRSAFTVTDGDTIRLKDRAKGTRLVGFNAPESIEPRCDAEGKLGRSAKARLVELVAKARLDLTMVPCSCRPGTEGTDACNYSRSCGVLRADGQDVGEVLISEGLAVPFVCGSTSCPPTPRPWCG